MATSSSTRQPATPLMAPRQFIGAVEDHWELYSDQASDYSIGSPIGFGASSIVYSAMYKPRDRSEIPVALKVLDLDSLPPRSLSLLQRETTLMSLSKHPNVLRVRGSWMDGHKLFIAMRLMSKGSAADVMHYGWPGGMEEDVVRCILRQALLGLNYLHINGFIHRDVKAANLLVDDDGTVLLGDLGVAADLTEDRAVLPPPGIRSISQLGHTRHSSSTDNGSTRRVVLVEPVTSSPSAPTRPKMGKRKSFVGTPCWMAPELIQGQNYDSSADIWSFGITALELTQGRPPRSRESPQKVLLRTIQEAPPTLDRDGGTYKYSRVFQEMVESCLAKDPSKRPTAEELLQTPFFKGAKKPSYLINTILKDLPPLVHRQERRALPLTQTHRSVDSWDFATTIHSPTNSVRIHGLEKERLSSEGSGDKHSRAVSWVENAIMPEETETEADEPSSDSDFTSITPSTSPEDVRAASPLAEKQVTQVIRPQSLVSEKTMSETETSTQSSTAPVLVPLPKSASGKGLWSKLKKNANSIRRSSSFSGPKPSEPNK